MLLVRKCLLSVVLFSVRKNVLVCCILFTLVLGSVYCCACFLHGGIARNVLIIPLYVWYMWRLDCDCESGLLVTARLYFHVIVWLARLGIH